MVTLDSLSGPLHVRREKDGLVLDFPLQKVGQQLDASPLATALNLPQTNIVEVVRACDDVIVVITDESHVKQLKPDFEKIFQIDARGVIVTAASQTFDCVSRFFAPSIGVNEDPVTGSAHCKLADYWSQKLKKINLACVSSQSSEWRASYSSPR